MTSEFKVIQISESEYRRLCRDAAEGKAKEQPFTVDELYQLINCVAAMMGGVGGPLYKKLRGMIATQLEKEIGG